LFTSGSVQRGDLNNYNSVHEQEQQTTQNLVFDLLSSVVLFISSQGLLLVVAVTKDYRLPFWSKETSWEGVVECVKVVVVEVIVWLLLLLVVIVGVIVIVCGLPSPHIKRNNPNETRGIKTKKNSNYES
jgi:hypothetical protein